MWQDWNEVRPDRFMGRCNNDWVVVVRNSPGYQRILLTPAVMKAIGATDYLHILVDGNKIALAAGQRGTKDLKITQKSDGGGVVSLNAVINHFNLQNAMYRCRMEDGYLFFNAKVVMEEIPLRRNATSEEIDAEFDS